MLVGVLIGAIALTSVIPCLGYLWILFGAPLFPQTTYAVFHLPYSATSTVQKQFSLPAHLSLVTGKLP